MRDSASADLVAIVGMGERDGALLLIDAGGELWVMDTPQPGGWVRLVLDDAGTGWPGDDVVVSCEPVEFFSGRNQLVMTN